MCLILWLGARCSCAEGRPTSAAATWRPWWWGHSGKHKEVVCGMSAVAEPLLSTCLGNSALGLFGLGDLQACFC